MQGNPPEKRQRRIAVILGPRSSGRHLLGVVGPLLGKDRAMEMQGVFVEEAGLRHAAALPFVKELCRVTFSVREFNSDQFERVLALRMRTAQRALELLARRAGVAHTFRNVRGSADSLLRETVNQSDITIFEPAGTLAASMATSQPPAGYNQRIVVYLAEVESAGAALSAASQLANGDAHRIFILLDPRIIDALPELKQRMQTVFPVYPARIRPLIDSTAETLTAAVRTEGAGMLVLSATGESTSPAFLAEISKGLRCPICVVRVWSDP